MRIKIGKWYFIIHNPIQIITIEEFHHECLNQIMEGSYECEWCNPKEASG